MCVVSMIMDHYHDRWFPRLPSPWEVSPYGPTAPGVPYVPPAPMPAPPRPFPFTPVSPEEVEEFRRLLERAREYDKRNNEPDCEMEEKRKKLKALADELGVNIDFV